MAGISEIAKKAKVSKTAVSFAINNKPGISAETRKNILAIAHELDFKPRKRKKAPTVDVKAGKIGFLKIASHGHIVNRDHDAFIADYIYGIDQECKKHNYDFTLFDFHSLDISKLRAMDLLNCNGLIVLGTELSREEVISISKLKVPIVFLDTYYDFLPLNFITMNNRDALFSILSFLRDKGLEDIQMITTKSECANISEREVAFFDAIDQLGLPKSQDSLLDFEPTFLGAYKGMFNLLGAESELPQAFVCANDIIALGCIKALKERGIKIPEDISITGFDDLPGSAMTDPALTSYQVPKKKIGKVGIQILIGAIKQKGLQNGFSSIKTRVDGKMIGRDTA